MGGAKRNLSKSAYNMKHQTLRIGLETARQVTEFNERRKISRAMDYATLYPFYKAPN